MSLSMQLVLNIETDGNRIRAALQPNDDLRAMDPRARLHVLRESAKVLVDEIKNAQIGAYLASATRPRARR